MQPLGTSEVKMMTFMLHQPIEGSKLLCIRVTSFPKYEYTTTLRTDDSRLRLDCGGQRKIANQMMLTLEINEGRTWQKSSSLQHRRLLHNPLHCPESSTAQWRNLRREQTASLWVRMMVQSDCRQWPSGHLLTLCIIIITG